MTIEIERQNQYGEPTGSTLTIEYDFKPGYFYSNPRNEAEYLDPGEPDVVTVRSATLERGGRVRTLKVTQTILDIVSDWYKWNEGYTPVVEY